MDLNDLKLSEYLISIIIGLFGFSVRFFYGMSVSLRDISNKMPQITEIMKDHEQRLRVLENKKNIKGA